MGSRVIIGGVFFIALIVFLIGLSAKKIGDQASDNRQCRVSCLEHDWPESRYEHRSKRCYCLSRDKAKRLY